MRSFVRLFAMIAFCFSILCQPNPCQSAQGTDGSNLSVSDMVTTTTVEGFGLVKIWAEDGDPLYHLELISRDYIKSISGIMDELKYGELLVATHNSYRGWEYCTIQEKQLIAGGNARLILNDLQVRLSTLPVSYMASGGSYEMVGLVTEDLPLRILYIFRGDAFGKESRPPLIELQALQERIRSAIQWNCPSSQ